MDTTPLPEKRRGGRRRTLNREQLVSVTLQMLHETDLDSFSMPKLARRIGVGVMTLYTYFPSRDALLDAAAEHAFLQWEEPAQQDRWQDFVLAWLDSLLTHFERYPVALQIIAWDEHLSRGWQRAWLPILRLMKEQGLEGGDLAFAASWFSHAAIGFIQAHVFSPKGLPPIPGEDVRYEQGHDHDLFQTVREHAARQLPEVLTFGLGQIVNGLEVLFLRASRAEPASDTTGGRASPRD